MPLEAQGYSDVESGRVTTFLPGWSPARAAESGASACKLLLPYRPDHEASAVLQDAVVAEAVAGCRAVGLPLILEPIAYPLPSEDASTLPGRLGPIVLASVERLRPIGADILKLQFPRDADAAAEAEWCRKIDEACARHALGAARRRRRRRGLRARRRGVVQGGRVRLHRGPHALAGRARPARATSSSRACSRSACRSSSACGRWPSSTHGPGGSGSRTARSRRPTGGAPRTAHGGAVRVVGGDRASVLVLEGGVVGGAAGSDCRSWRRVWWRGQSRIRLASSVRPPTAAGTMWCASSSRVAVQPG